MSLKCFECGWPRVSRTREGALVCPRCGTKAAPGQKIEEASERPSKVVQVYTFVFAAFALTFPFLVPIILKLSRLYPMEFGPPL